MPERRRRRGPMIDFLLIGLIITLTTIILVIILSKDDFKFQKKLVPQKRQNQYLVIYPQKALRFQVYVL